MNINLLFSCLFILLSELILAQTGRIHGTITADGVPIAFAQLVVEGTSSGAVTNNAGEYDVRGLSYASYTISVSYLGYKKIYNHFTLDQNNSDVSLNFNLSETVLNLDHIVVTGTKTNKTQTQSPVLVGVISSQTLSNVQACNLAEGLRFQPGLRVETNCQTCNYTQLRINGLAGGYSQILINGRPIFSPLTGLYGLEQLPANMIDRIEVIRGGGSSLYGSSAIGGTVNVITKIPEVTSYEIGYTYQNIDRQTNDNILTGNASLVSDSKNAGVSIFVNKRERDFYDANGDNFSEIASLTNFSLGASFFILPKENQKLELSVSRIHEYRLGGEMENNKPAYLAEQAEERTQNVWMATADYQINFNKDRSSFISYIALQKTDRNHFTGIRPDTTASEYESFLANPPYGTSSVNTFTVGTQVNHKVSAFFGGENVFTTGVEYLYDAVQDEIPAYRYTINQTTKDVGAFLQSDWSIVRQLSLLSGIRMDKHNLVNGVVFSPRAALLYEPASTVKLRLNYGAGFRAPQAFDSDLHIAFAGGGVSRVALSPSLRPETSQSYSASFSYDKPRLKWINGITVEGFYTRLDRAFYLQPLGQDQFGQLFEKQNGDGATVQGITLDYRLNYNRKIQLESGYTLQTSRFDKPVEYILGVAGTREFVRTPNNYGYAVLTIVPSKKWKATFNYVQTGQMKIPHFAGAPNQLVDEIVRSKAYSDMSIKVVYTRGLDLLCCKLELYSGLRNIFNSYQDDFDIGKNRDSNYIYGPSIPRLFFVGITLKSN